MKIILDLDKNKEEHQKKAMDIYHKKLAREKKPHIYNGKIYP